jgi:hypothetical protein
MDKFFGEIEKNKKKKSSKINIDILDLTNSLLIVYVSCTINYVHVFVNRLLRDINDHMHYIRKYLQS